MTLGNASGRKGVFDWGKNIETKTRVAKEIYSGMSIVFICNKTMILHISKNHSWVEK